MLSLYSGFKETQQVHLHDFGNLFPLLRSRVHTGGVVSASMEQNHTLLWDGLAQYKERKSKST